MLRDPKQKDSISMKCRRERGEECQKNKVSGKKNPLTLFFADSLKGFQLIVEYEFSYLTRLTAGNILTSHNISN
jgi:hypothetical protein